MKDKALMTQMRVLACLIDGSYKDQLKIGDFDDGLPEWEMSIFSCPTTFRKWRKWC